jgi:hypothetical protein
MVSCVEEMGDHWLIEVWGGKTDIGVNEELVLGSSSDFFGLVWFLFIKIIKLKFYKIKNKTETGLNRSVLILFGYFILKNQNLTDRFWFRLVWFRLVWFWCGLVWLFYIKNQKLYFFWVIFFYFLIGLVSIWFSFFGLVFYFFQFGSVFRFQT